MTAGTGSGRDEETILLCVISVHYGWHCWILMSVLWDCVIQVLYIVWAQCEYKTVISLTRLCTHWTVADRWQIGHYCPVKLNTVMVFMLLKSSLVILKLQCTKKMMSCLVTFALCYSLYLTALFFFAKAVSLDLTRSALINLEMSKGYVTDKK